MASDINGINGDPTALLIDRAVGELRRGRAIALEHDGEHLIFAAAENLRPSLFERMKNADGSPMMLVVTEQRAAALGLMPSADKAIGLAVGSDWTADDVRALAGVGDAASIREVRDAANGLRVSHEAAVQAALILAKAGRLVPALVFTPRQGPRDRSLIEVPVSQVLPYTTFFKHRLRRTSQARVPLADAVESEITLFRDEHTLGEHIAIVVGSPDVTQVVPVRLHSACLTGDLLGSLRCDCGEQLRTAVARIAELGGGVLLYLDQEGRGIGLANKLRAYALQDAGLDTLDADRHLGFLADERDYDVAAVLLQELGISRIQLLTNNPQKIEALKEHGIDVVGRLPLVTTANAHNERYIRAKRERAGHLAEESNG
jgi:GTP cyclohydrolase II